MRVAEQTVVDLLGGSRSIPLRICSLALSLKLRLFLNSRGSMRVECDVVDSKA